MKLNVVVVDDSEVVAEEIANAIQCFESRYTNLDVCYEVIKLIKGRPAFVEAKEFIINKQKDIDIIFTDYDLIDGKGTDLLLLLNPEYRIFKVVHSITTTSASKILKLKKVIINEYYDRKGKESVDMILKEFENTILKIKLFGHPSYSNRTVSSYLNRSKAYEGELFSQIPLYEILYAYTLSENDIGVVYRDKNGNVDDTKISGKRLTFFTASDFDFIKISRSEVINLLWVANIKIIERKIGFIAFHNHVKPLEFELRDFIKSRLISLSLTHHKQLPEFFQ